MSKVTFSKLGLKLTKEVVPLQIGEHTLEIAQYLPVQEKTEFLQFVLERAIDHNIGCYSPLRLEIYTSIAFMKWYAGITFTEKQIADIGKTYDLLDSNHVIDAVVGRIPQEESAFMYDMVNQTAKDAAAYNTSLAGIINNMSSDSDNLVKQMQELADQIQRKENIELFNAVKEDIVGQ